MSRTFPCSFPFRAFAFKVHCCCFYSPCPALSCSSYSTPRVQTFLTFLESLPSIHYLHSYQSTLCSSNNSSHQKKNNSHTCRDPGNQQPLHHDSKSQQCVDQWSGLLFIRVAGTTSVSGSSHSGQLQVHYVPDPYSTHPVLPNPHSTTQSQ